LLLAIAYVNVARGSSTLSGTSIEKTEELNATRTKED
jgi:hypothetical protein